MNDISTHPRWLTPTNCFYALLILHVTFWTLLPTCVRFVLPLDAMEGALWGQQLEWGYDKDPLLNAWLTRLAIELSGGKDWTVYLFSQLSVAICFWAVFQLGKRILAPWYAFLAVLLLEGMQYFHLAAIDFDDNVLQLPTWALTILCLYSALKTQRILPWIGVGFFAGLAFLAKYYAVMLFVPIIVFLVFNREARRSFYSMGFYLGALTAFLIVLPHLIWLTQHDFITFHYSMGQTDKSVALLDHFRYPFSFFLAKIVAFLAPFFLFSLFFFGQVKGDVLERPVPLLSFDKQFLLYLGLGSFLLTLLVSLVMGLDIHALWTMPTVLLWGLLLVAFKPPVITTARLFRCFIILGTLMLILMISYAVSLIRAKDTSSANFPGREIAARLTQEWHTRYQTPLPYVAGSRWIGGNIARYSPDHPRVYIEWNKKVSSWINEEKLNKQGAIFVWSVKDLGTALPPDLLTRFPRLEHTIIQRYHWKRDVAIPPVEIGVAFLPPAQ